VTCKVPDLLRRIDGLWQLQIVFTSRWQHACVSCQVCVLFLHCLYHFAILLLFNSMSISSTVVDEERMRQGHWLGQFFDDFFSALAHKQFSTAL